jgi:Cytochrome P460
MSLRETTALASVSAAAALMLAYSAIAQGSFGGDRIKFPEGFDTGVLYTTVDRADLKQYRELFGPAAAVEAAKKGQPLPDGTVLTLVQYKAKLDAQGNPEKDANGRFIKGDVVGYAVMEKQPGWGTTIPEDIRNANWEYRGFKADKSVNDKANLKGCFECHKKLDAKLDFTFSYEKLAGK